MVTAVALAVLLATSPAKRAEEPPASPPPRPAVGPVGLRIEAGLGGPNGLTGVSGFWAPVSSLRVQAGTGFGMSGLQLSCGLSFVVGEGADRFVPGVFASLGLPTSEANASVRTHHDGPALAMPWLNIDLLAWEHVYSRGTSFFVGGGALAPMRRGHWDSGDLGGDYAPFEGWMPFVRFGFGWSFRRPR